jgi:hypothetical protein
VCNGIGMVEHLPHTRALRQALDNHYHEAINASSPAISIYKFCLASSSELSRLFNCSLPAEAQTFTAEPRAAISHQNELESSPRILSYRQSSSIAT